MNMLKMELMIHGIENGGVRKDRKAGEGSGELSDIKLKPPFGPDEMLGPILDGTAEGVELIPTDEGLTVRPIKVPDGDEPSPDVKTE